MMVKFKWSIIHGKYEIGCLCACRHKYFKYNKLNTSCNPQYYHDDVSASLLTSAGTTVYRDLIRSIHCHCCWSCLFWVARKGRLLTPYRSYQGLADTLFGPGVLWRLAAMEIRASDVRMGKGGPLYHREREVVF